MSPNDTVASLMPAQSVTVTYTGTAGTTTALPSTTRHVRVVSTTDCFIEIGLSPTAVANTGCYLVAYIPEYFVAQPNAKVSAIQVASGGSIYVTPIA